MINSLITACKRLWKAIVEPTRVYTIHIKLSEEESREVWDRVDKAFKKAEEAFEEMDNAFDSLKKK